jgi:hypothetical protein
MIQYLWHDYYEIIIVLMRTETGKKELLIDNKIISKEDIAALVKLLIIHSGVILEKSKDARRKDLLQKELKEAFINEGDVDTSHSRLEFTSSDHIKYTGTFEESAELIEVLNKKIITEINLYFTEQVLTSSVLIRIKNSDISPVYAKVESQDINWVNQTVKSLEDFFSKCRSQSAIVKKSGALIVLLTVVILNFILNNTMEIIAQMMHLFSKYAIQSLTSDWRFFVFILSFITVSPAILVYKRLRKLWPGIEIQTGKDFRLIEKDKQRKLLIIVSILIFPAIISYLLLLL